MEDNKTQEAPTPCTAGCGFYGSKLYNSMCSKCFKELEQESKKDESIFKVIEESSSRARKEEQAPPDNKEEEKATAIHQTEEEEEKVNKAVAAKEPVEEEPVEEEPQKPIQKNKGRCFSCRSKIQLVKQLTNKCRCEYVFCDTHRFPDKHDCVFDHAEHDKVILAKNNKKLNEKPRGGNEFNRLD